MRDGRSNHDPGRFPGKPSRRSVGQALLRAGRLLPLALALGCALVVSGCPTVNSRPCTEDAQCPGGACRLGACGPQCRQDAECAAGLRCVAQACVPPPECALDGDCASGFQCIAGSCRCGSDNACAVNEACLSGACAVRPACHAEADCAPYGRHCEVSQGLCLNPCADATECAPGTNPQLAGLLYQCVQGVCERRCTTTAQCAAGLTCLRGGCVSATCSTRSDCGAGEYCTSATGGQCLPLVRCEDASGCPAGQGCRALSGSNCPPGLDCSTPLCTDNPTCLLDSDCLRPLAPGYCANGRCVDALSCPTGSCPSGQLCVAGACYPSGCRGLGDCTGGEGCIAGACVPPPAPSELTRLVLTPSTLTVGVGGSAAFTLVAYRADGSSVPAPQATYAIVDASGAPSPLATVSPAGVITALAAGEARLRATVSGSSAAPAQARLSIHAQVTSGRRVTVIDALSRLPLSGVTVVGCDGPPASGPCPAPEQRVTDASGEASFAFTAPLASFLAASPQLRPDGLPLSDQVGVAGTSATDLLLALTPNTVEEAAGAVETISFGQVHTRGNLWLAFGLASAADPSALELSTYLGETFLVSLPGSTQKLPLPGSAEVSFDPGVGFPVPLQSRSRLLAQPGLRHLATFAGRFELTQGSALTSGDLLAYTSGMDFGLTPFVQLPGLPRVPDETDLDGDGLCSDPQRCPAGGELLPDYARFPQLPSAPALLQADRTEVVLPDLPAGLDTAIVTSVATSGEAGLLPLGLSSRAGGLPGIDGTRPLGSLLLRSGAPGAGVEAGTRGVWAVAVQTQGRGLTAASPDASGRIVRADPLPPRVVVPPFLPLLSASTYAPETRTLSPGQPSWNAATSAGANLGRLVIEGPTVRQVIFFTADGAQTSVRVPDPVAGFPDPASAVGVSWQLTALQFDTPAEDVFDLAGSNLEGWLEHLIAYSRFRSR